MKARATINKRVKRYEEHILAGDEDSMESEERSGKRIQWGF
jgi:hypothetical protein